MHEAMKFMLFVHDWLSSGKSVTKSMPKHWMYLNIYLTIMCSVLKFYWMSNSLGVEPMTLALLTVCSNC